MDLGGRIPYININSIVKSLKCLCSRANHLIYTQQYIVKLNITATTMSTPYGHRQTGKFPGPSPPVGIIGLLIYVQMICAVNRFRLLRFYNDVIHDVQLFIIIIYICSRQYEKVRYVFAHNAFIMCANMQFEMRLRVSVLLMCIRCV